MSDTNFNQKESSLDTATTNPTVVATKVLNNTTNTDACASDSSTSDECIVCFKNVEIYSIGECDHPVCYECSTRMRVLCQQNECPICRHVLGKVIFTYDKLPYRELELKNRSEYYSKRYKIGFATSAIQQAFFKLLDHPCPKCNTMPYRTFQGLKQHVRKEHDLYYCEICVEHLRIFTFERRCYTQQEMGIHRSRGDADNRSHRGHPLCEYCKQRFLDQYELFRHLRREHYFCHFCDADGFNEFYGTYESLADHFRKDHYLCEEGKCATEQFVGAFRSEIDYKAHVANVHGKSLSKQQAKQTRTLQLEITLGPRNRSGQNDPTMANLRSRGKEEKYDDEEEISTLYAMQPTPRPVNIDADNEQEFPSLAGSTATPNLSLARPPPQSLRSRSTTAGLARTKENFPALGGETGGKASDSANMSQNKAPPLATMLKKSPLAMTGAIPRTTTASFNGNTSGVIIHVSNRPSSSSATSASVAATAKKSELDFPALPTNKSKKYIRQLDMDLPSQPSQVPMGPVAAKHRTLVDDYVSVANSSNFQKLQIVQKDELEQKSKKVERTNAPKLNPDDFPSLGGTNNSAINTSSWAKVVPDKKQRELENRKSKVAAAPVLPSNTKIWNNKSVATNSDTNSVAEATIKKEKKKKPPQDSNQSKANTPAKEKNNNENKSKNANVSNASRSNNIPQANGKIDTTSSSMRPPPGFTNHSNSAQPPSDFHSDVTVNSVAKPPNNLTFTTSLGQSYSIIPAHSYIHPPDALQRNQKLVNHFKEMLSQQEALEEFRHISQRFREGSYIATAYYDHCKAALKHKFNKVFPELLALLPDISKQQALYLVHSQNLYMMDPNQRKLLPKLEVCSVCKQVVLNNDMVHHTNAHEFPKLGSSSSKVAVGNRQF